MTLTDFTSATLQGLGQLPAHAMQPFPFRLPGGQLFPQKLGPGHLQGRKGGAEDQRAHFVDQVGTNYFATDHIGSHGGQCLAERTDQQVDLSDTTTLF